MNHYFLPPYSIQHPHHLQKSLHGNYSNYVICGEHIICTRLQCMQAPETVGSGGGLFPSKVYLC